MSDTPVVAWATPDDRRVVWQAYIDEAVKVRRLASGIVEVAVRDEDWQEL